MTDKKTTEPTRTTRTVPIAEVSEGDEFLFVHEGGRKEWTVVNWTGPQYDTYNTTLLVGHLLEFENGYCDIIPPDHEVSVRPRPKGQTVTLKNWDRVIVGDRSWVVRNGELTEEEQ